MTTIPPEANLSAMTDKELLALMVSRGRSGEWLEAVGSKRICELLQGRFEPIMSWNDLPAAERIRHRLGSLLLKERSSSSPFYAAKDEAYWMRRHLSAWNV